MRTGQGWRIAQDYDSHCGIQLKADTDGGRTGGGDVEADGLSDLASLWWITALLLLLLCSFIFLPPELR